MVWLKFVWHKFDGMGNSYGHVNFDRELHGYTLSFKPSYGLTIIFYGVLTSSTTMQKLF